MNRKHLFIWLVCLIGLTAFVACSDGGDTEYFYNLPEEYESPKDSTDSTNTDAQNVVLERLTYNGTWSFSGGNKTQRSEVSAPVIYLPQGNMLTLYRMPNDLIRQMAGWEGTVTEYLQYDYAYETHLHEKGYTTTSKVYAFSQFNVSYVFQHEDQRHVINLVLDNTSEMIFDTYTEAITLVMVVKEVYLDEKLVATNPGYLMLEGSQPTKEVHVVRID